MRDFETGHSREKRPAVLLSGPSVIEYQRISCSIDES
jgi:hypothetical protein